MEDYGGRGIKNKLGDDIIDAFKNLSKVPGFKPGLQIDRIDYNGDYTIHHPLYGFNIYEDAFGHKCLGNLRWVTPKFNACNKRGTVALHLNKISIALIPRSKRSIVRWIIRHGELCNLGIAIDYTLVKLDKMRYIRDYNNTDRKENVYVGIHNKIIKKCPRLYRLIMMNLESLQTERKFLTPEFNKLYLNFVLPNIKPIKTE